MKLKNTLHFVSKRNIGNQVSKINRGDTVVCDTPLTRHLYLSHIKNQSINESKLNIKYITLEEFHSMKGTKDNKKFPFDYGLMNPAYSNGDELLYTSFFEKGLELCETVEIVMPADLESNATRLKSHNNKVKTHMIDISENVTDQFGVGIKDIRCITASLTVENEVAEYVDPLDSYTVLYPKRKRLAPRRGMGQFSNLVNRDENGVAVITGIYRGNRVEYTKVKSEVATKVKADMISDAPYFVLVNENPSSGLFNTAIIKNDGTKWGSGAFGLDANSKKEAEKLEQWLVSKEIQTEVQKMLALKNQYSFTGAMMKKLPFYE